MQAVKPIAKTHANQQPRTNIIEVRNVTRSLPLGGEQVSILKGVSFAIPRGSWIAITGPSGSGKSTLLGLLAGLDTPSSGEVIIDGEDISHQDEKHLAQFRNVKIGMVFQSFNLIPTLTALENVEVPLYASKDAKYASARARQALQMVGLEDRLKHRPHQLSGGQQQRVAIARALVNNPALLIADEPTGNLDSLTGEAVLDLFAKLREELGLTLIIATHDPAVAARVDGVLHLVDGKLAERGIR
jgi:putative ABC transport system ATP-binding protein